MKSKRIGTAIIRISEMAALAAIALLLAVTSWNATSRWMETGSTFMQDEVLRSVNARARARVRLRKNLRAGPFFKGGKETPLKPDRVRAASMAQEWQKGRVKGVTAAKGDKPADGPL